MRWKASVPNAACWDVAPGISILQRRLRVSYIRATSLSGTSFVLGDVWSGIKKREVAEMFRHTSILEKRNCRSCWARYLCSGGCHAVSYRSSGDIAGVDDVACEITRMRLEAALAAYALSASNE